MHPVPLLSGLGKHLPQRRPEPERTVADRQHRRSHAMLPAVAQQVCPRLGRLPVPVGQGDQLLAPVGPYTDDDQGAHPVLVEAIVDVDTVDPAVDVVHDGKVPLGEPALLLPTGVSPPASQL